VRPEGVADQRVKKSWGVFGPLMSGVGGHNRFVSVQAASRVVLITDARRSRQGPEGLFGELL